MVSLHDVAKLAGVSKSTVSRVLNNEYGVKPSTKERVEQAIQSSGYVINQVAKDLKSRTTNLIGVIVPRMSSHATAQGVDGLTAALEKAGKQVLLANAHQSHQKEVDFIRVFNQKRVEGIIMYATHLSDTIIQAIKMSQSPVVIVGQDASVHGIPSIVHDDYRVGIAAGERLLARGSRTVGFIGVQADDLAVDGLRYQGLSDALGTRDKTPIFHARGDFSIESGYRLAQLYYQRFPEMDGLFCATDRLAVGAIKALREMDVDVGQQVKVLGVGNDELAVVSHPSLSTFSYAFDKAGKHAAQMLLSCMQGQDIDMKKVVLGFEQIQRETC